LHFNLNYFSSKQEFFSHNEREMGILPVLEPVTARDALATEVRYARLPTIRSSPSSRIFEVVVPVNCWIAYARRNCCHLLTELRHVHPDKLPTTMYDLLKSRLAEVANEALEMLASEGLADYVEQILVSIPDDIQHATDSSKYRLSLKVTLKETS
jgi:hypothetical protein